MTLPVLPGGLVNALCVGMIAAMAPLPRTSPKPRVRLRVDAPPLFMCGWCSKWDVEENLRINLLTGNNWPIHPHCVCEWYDGGPEAKP